MIGVFPVYAEDSFDYYVCGALLDDIEAVSDSNCNNFPCNYNTILPATVDLSTSDSFPPVGDQGYLGSCSAWATTYYQFGYQVATMNNWDAKNDLNKCFSPKWTYNLTNGSFDDGSNFSDIYNILSKQGAVRYTELTPNGYSTAFTEFREWCTDIDSLREALKYRLVEYKKYTFNDLNSNTPISSYNSIELVPMKSLLNSGFVLTLISNFDILDYRILSSEDGSSHVGEKVCIKQQDDLLNNGCHALAIVGYDDTIQYDLNEDGIIQNFEKGAFKIVNSYGTQYGNQGFMWVMYDALNSVSNVDEQNSDTRIPFIYSDYYYVIVVDRYSLDLTTEVTITVPRRNQVKLDLCLSSVNSVEPQQGPYSTLFSFKGGDYNFSGVPRTTQTATFPFDYATIVMHPAPWKNYYLQIRDSGFYTDYVIIDKIEFIDGSGKCVVSDTEEKSIVDRMAEFRYRIGMVGDVNNSGSVTALDATAIQQHLTKTVLLSDDALVLADVNADGRVSSTDAAYIQRVLAHIDDGFANGIYASLD